MRTYLLTLLLAFTAGAAGCDWISTGTEAQEADGQGEEAEREDPGQPPV